MGVVWLNLLFTTGFRWGLYDSIFSSPQVVGGGLYDSIFSSPHVLGGGCMAQSLVHHMIEVGVV